MARSSVVVKLVCLLVVAMAIAAPVAQAALNCGQVSKSIGPCINYLKTGGTVPSACCAGIRSLNSAAKTTVDRQSTCKCLQSAANSIKGINPDLAAGLPGKCGVNVPYKISLSTNCDKYVIYNAKRSTTSALYAYLYATPLNILLYIPYARTRIMSIT